ncbi:hypothetical protein PMAYCL1PPCAC_02385, partial [Pristionchus mayeri]
FQMAVAAMVQTPHKPHSTVQQPLQSTERPMQPRLNLSNTVTRRQLPRSIPNGPYGSSNTTWAMCILTVIMVINFIVGVTHRFDVFTGFAILRVIFSAFALIRLCELKTDGLSGMMGLMCVEEFFAWFVTLLGILAMVMNMFSRNVYPEEGASASMCRKCFGVNGVYTAHEEKMCTMITLSTGLVVIIFYIVFLNFCRKIFSAAQTEVRVLGHL